MVRLYDKRGLEERLPRARLPKLLWRADRLLRDYEFLRPFREEMSTQGRPTIPLESYFRLMFLKGHFGWGYERLVAEVEAEPHLRRFCRIASEARIPHSTTLLKLTHRFGRSRLDGLLQAAWDRLGQTKGGARCSA